ncbi:MAG TPA: glycosyltransferase [Candidatus Binatia bacterium]|nr:glycosyltransferase [Candidatus Binatia bacterium]
MIVALHAAILAVLAVAALHALLNHLVWPRLAPPAAGPAPRWPRVSVLIPARNEARRIGPALRGWLEQDYPDYEVLVFDDDSEDDTAARVAAVAGSSPRLRLLRGGALPPGWRGKPWACHNLAREARGELLVFADADVVPAPSTLRAAAGRLLGDCDVVSAVPRHRAARPTVLALVALQNWAALSFVPAWLTAFRPLAAVNGQFVALRRDVYAASGGFAAVRGALAEDAALGRHLAGLGYRVRLLDGAALLASEPHATLAEACRANARTLLPLLFGSSALLVLALALLGGAWVLPPLWLAIGLASGGGETSRLGLAVVEVALGIGPRWLADRRAGYPVWLAVTHPLAVAALVGSGLASLAWFRWRRRVDWRGRRYSVSEAA